jgi:hypothetical protein
MLQLYELPQLPPQNILQQDGTPPHVYHHDRNQMAGRWVGKVGPMAWSPRSPDLTPPDFFFGGHVKNTVYQIKTRDPQHLKARIRDAVVMETCFKQRGTRSNIVWISVVPPKELTFKFIEKVIYSTKKTLIVSLCNGVTN